MVYISQGVDARIYLTYIPVLVTAKLSDKWMFNFMMKWWTNEYRMVTFPRLYLHFPDY